MAGQDDPNNPANIYRRNRAGTGASPPSAPPVVPNGETLNGPPGERTLNDNPGVVYARNRLREQERISRPAARELDNRMTDGERRVAGLRLIGRGAPIVGNLVSHTDNSRALEQSRPGTAMIASLIGGVGPLGAASRVLSRMRLPGGARVGDRFATDAPAQTLLGAGTTLADRHLSDRPPTGFTENAIVGGFGAAGGIAGPVIGRMLGPGGVRSPPRPQSEITLPPPPPVSMSGDEIARRVRGSAERGPGLAPVQDQSVTNASLQRITDENARRARAANLPPAGAPPDLGSFRPGDFAAGLGAYMTTGEISHALGAAGANQVRRNLQHRLWNSDRVRNHRTRQISQENQDLINALTLAAGNAPNQVAPPVD